MKALFYDGQLELVDDYPLPRRRAGEALIKVITAGICNTDLEVVKGYMDYKGVLGHEFVGMVEDGDHPKFLGKRVVGEINCSCGECHYCLQGLKAHCPQRTVLGMLDHDGAFADYLTLPVENLHPLPEGVSDEEGVFVEPIAAGFQILEQAHIKPIHRVILLGDGKLGLLAGQLLRLTGCQLLVVGKHREKLAILEQKGIEARLVEDIEEAEADVVVDCTGSAGGLWLAMKLVRPRGVIVLKSTVAESYRLHLAPLVVDEITLIGSRCGPFPPAIRALKNGLIDVKPLIWKVYKLEEGLEAVKEASKGEALKVILKMD